MQTAILLSNYLLMFCRVNTIPNLYSYHTGYEQKNLGFLFSFPQANALSRLTHYLITSARVTWLEDEVKQARMAQSRLVGKARSQGLEGHLDF